MKEADYIKATNRTKIATALHQMEDVLAGPKYGVPAAIQELLVVMLQELNDSIVKDIGEFDNAKRVEP